MSTVGQKERQTQSRVIRLFVNRLGYEYAGDWTDRPNNRNVEEDRLRHWLAGRRVPDALITRALHQLNGAAALGDGRSLYDANREVYQLLRYGVKVKEGVGEQNRTVWLIDWEKPDRNDFAIAEEVTVQGELTKRPDLVLYVNGIALGVLELKRSTRSVSHGIRQNLDNQKKVFIRPFFSTVQLVMAGNDTEGLRYGVIETSEKHYLAWREENRVWRPGAPAEHKYLPDNRCDEADNVLDCALARLCSKERLLEVIHDFIVFDAGTKKTCRHNQYFGVRAAQKHVRQREGGIIWHTQGSGKSLTMVWLAKWIRENVPDSRVLIITDRTELDEQIERVFLGVDEDIYRTKSGADLISQLNATTPWLLCSLVHKFGRREDAAVTEFVEEITRSLPADFRPKGELFVFVDECHRTQSGTLHDAMKAILPNAMFIGFTGTPLLKADKKRSIEVFGPYIHTYKFDEAVRDGVVLDLRYEARDIDQDLTSPQKVDQWFEAKTRGLSDIAKAQLKQRWGTMQKVLSSRPRLRQIVNDVLMDMETRDRLMSGRGNAMLVTGSIYQACNLYEMFSRTDLSGKCAIITSYRPTPNDIKGEETGEGMTERLRQYEIYRKMLAEFFDEPEDTAMYRVEEFEKKVKERFIKEPGQMRLLIVVDKLLTGFDAPPATYLYIDKEMYDHGLFQAICRVNRLDGEDKEYGYVIDYKDLFKSLKGAIKDYTGAALDGFDRQDVAGLLENRLEKGRDRLEEALEAVRALCEPVAPPQDTGAYLHYFCAVDTGDKNALKENEPKRLALYHGVAALVRAFANVANEMPDLGYATHEIHAIRQDVAHYESVRKEVKLASGDYVDMKVFEPAMRHLLDTYIRADESQVVSSFDDLTLVEMIVEQGIGALDRLPRPIRENREAMAETIENNIRRVIIDEQAVNPKYYEKMSELLDALIRQRKADALDYKAYLQKVLELTNQLNRPDTTSYPPSLDTPAKRALYDNLGHDEALAIQVDTAIRYTKKEGWRNNRFKVREVLQAIRKELGASGAQAEEILDLVQKQHEY